MHKLMKNDKGSDDTSIGSRRSFIAPEEKLTSERRSGGNYQAKIFLNDVFDFPEHHENAHYALGFFEFCREKVKIMF